MRFPLMSNRNPKAETLHRSYNSYRNNKAMCQDYCKIAGVSVKNAHYSDKKRKKEKETI